MAGSTEALGDTVLTPQEVLQRFEDTRQVGDGQFEARCPAHEDRTASLSIGVRGETTLVCCHAGCDTNAVLQAVGLTMKDLMPTRDESNGNGKVIVANYDYRDEQGNLLYQAVRFFPKDFRQRRPDGKGGWIWSVKGCRKVPYRLPELLAADPATTIYKVEGEKDSDRLSELGLVATCNVGGAGKWRREYGEHFRGRNVVILPDSDDSGRDDANQVAGMLHGVAASVRVVHLPDLPPKGDASDWLDGLGEAADPLELLDEMGDKTPSWTPLSDASDNVTLPPAKHTGRGKPSLASDGLSAVVSPIHIGQLVEDYPRLNHPVIRGLLRARETANIIAGAKVGKSWLSYGLALSVVTGGDWLGRFPCEPGRALLLDNELHPATIAHRIPEVARAMHIEPSEYAEKIDAISLRGAQVDLYGLQRTIDEVCGKNYAIVIADAWYRFLPPGISENDNAAVMALYNRLDFYTDQLGAAWVNVHHASKGAQGDKAVTDVGAGAGSQSRAADTHIVLRPHEDDGVTVLDAALRSFPPVEPLALRWSFPIWHPVDGVDPRRLKRAQSVQDMRRQAEREAGIGKIIVALSGGKSGVRSEVQGWTGLSRHMCERLLDQLQSEGRVVCEETEYHKNPAVKYALSPTESATKLTTEEGGLLTGPETSRQPP